MSIILAVLGWALFAMAIIVGLVLDLVGLFGNWIILLAVGLAAAATHFEHFDGWTLPVLLALAVLGEILEAGASSLGAARFGGGKGSMAAALAGCLVGAIIGTPWLPIIGTLIGACVGAFVAAMGYEIIMREKDVETAAWVGVGAAAGKVAGLFLKTFVGLGMLVAAAIGY